MEASHPPTIMLKQVRRSTADHQGDTTTTMGKISGPIFKSQQPGSEETTPRAGAGLANLLRRRTLRHSVTAMINMRRMSRAIGLMKGPISVASTQPRQVNFENTYRMGPDSETQFSSSKVSKITESVLAETLTGMRYNAAVSKELASDLSTLIKDRVKKMGFPRYKIVCQIIIGERREQGLEVATRCLWSSDTDDWACATFTNDSLFAVAMIHAAYFE